MAAVAETLDREVAEWVIRLGGNVVTADPQPKVMADLSDLPQQDFRLHTVNLVGTNINPPDLVRLAELTHLKALYLPGPIFNPNAGKHPDHNPHMRHLAKLTDLEILQLSDHFITTIKLRDSGLEQIASLTNLRELRLALTEVKGKSLGPFRKLRFLDLSFAPVDDAGIKNVEGMAELSKLYLRDTQVSDEGLKSLSSLHQLTELDLHGTRVSDQGLSQLKDLGQLRKLNLLGTQVTDAGLENLLGMSQLEELVLYRTQVTNAGLEKLKQLKLLSSLDLRYTRTTRTGVAGLQAALPNCQIDFVDFALRPVGKVATAAPPVGKGAKAVAEWIQAMGGKAVWAERHPSGSLAGFDGSHRLAARGSTRPFRSPCGRPEEHRDWRSGPPILVTGREADGAGTRSHVDDRPRTGASCVAEDSSQTQPGTHPGSW